MISDKDKKLLKIIGITVVVLVVMYIIHNVYTNYAGKVVTEFALNYTQEETISVDGFAVRDEGTKKGKKNNNDAPHYTGCYTADYEKRQKNCSPNDPAQYSQCAV